MDYVLCTKHARTMLNIRSPHPWSKDRRNTPWCQCCGHCVCECQFQPDGTPVAVITIRPVAWPYGHGY